MYSVLQKAVLFAVNVILALGLLLFASGFFPHKAFIAGLAQWSGKDGIQATDAPFDRIIFMVVDALRRFNLLPACVHGLTKLYPAILFSQTVQIFILHIGTSSILGIGKV